MGYGLWHGFLPKHKTLSQPETVLVVPHAQGAASEILDIATCGCDCGNIHQCLLGTGFPGYKGNKNVPITWQCGGSRAYPTVPAYAVVKICFTQKAGW